MDSDARIVFVCEHGAAKSVMAAVYFNKLAKEMGMDVHAIARGTHPDSELSPQALQGLAEEGLAPENSVPQKLTAADLESALGVVSFCELPPEYQPKAVVERWENVPPVNEDYAKARQVIVEHIHQMLNR